MKTSLPFGKNNLNINLVTKLDLEGYVLLKILVEMCALLILFIVKFLLFIIDMLLILMVNCLEIHNAVLIIF